jgi:hypothetical protein
MSNKSIKFFHYLKIICIALMAINAKYDLNVTSNNKASFNYLPKIEINCN